MHGIQKWYTVTEKADNEISGQAYCGDELYQLSLAEQQRGNGWKLDIYVKTE